jgi:PDZ domain
MKKCFPWTLAFVGALLVGQARADDDDDKKKSEKKVIEVVTVEDDHHGEAGHGDDHHGDDSNKKTEIDEKHVIVLRGDKIEVDKMIANLEKQLENSKIDKETRKKILEQVREQLANAKGENSHTIQVHVDAHGAGDGEKKVTVQTNGKVVMVDENGKKHEFELKSGKPMVWSPYMGIGPGNLNIVQRNSELHMKKLHEEIVKQLQENGVQQSVIDKINEKLHDQMAKHMDIAAVPTIAAAPQYRLGIALEPNDDGKLVVSAVTDESPAAEGGVKEGDVIVSVNGDEVEELSTLIDAVQKAGKKNKSVSLKIMRGDDTVEMELKPNKSEEMAAEMPTELRGLVENLPQGIQGGFVVPGMPIPGGLEGVRGFSFSTEGMTDLKKEVDSLKEELGEIKALLKELKDRK